MLEQKSLHEEYDKGEKNRKSQKKTHHQGDSL